MAISGLGRLFLVSVVVCLGLSHHVQGWFRCPDELVVCQCGTSTTKDSVIVPIRRCRSQWLARCKPCEGYNKDTLCSQFRNCRLCNAQRDGGCSSCPDGYFGKHCQRGASCGPAPTLRHGRVTGSLGRDGQVGDVAAYHCDDGYKLVGPRQRRCDSSGRWTGGTPRCEYVCPIPAHGPTLNVNLHPYVTMATDDNPEGVSLLRRVTFSCKVGYKLQGPSELHCLPNNTWHDDIPNCLESVATCSLPKIPNNVEFVTERPRVILSESDVRRNAPFPRIGRNQPGDQFAPFTTLRFRCKSDMYRLIGSKTLTCQPSGEWNGPQPRCEPVCGKSKGAKRVRIIRGEDAGVGEYPWQAFVARGNNAGQFNGVCGGTLVSEDWMVTAAHCVTYLGSVNILPLEDIKIYLGKHYRDNSLDDEFVQEFEVAEVVVHDKYMPRSLDSDVALVKLKRSAEFSHRVMPICLPGPSPAGEQLLDNLLSQGSYVKVLGWGYTEDGNESNVLKVTTLKTISNAKCREVYDTLGVKVNITSNMFCAGHKDARSDTCTGDSGGPAISNMGPDDDMVWYLVGVVSWGGHEECAKPMYYSGFVRMSKFLDFVQHKSSSNTRKA